MASILEIPKETPEGHTPFFFVQCFADYDGHAAGGETPGPGKLTAIRLSLFKDGYLASSELIPIKGTLDPVEFVRMLAQECPDLKEGQTADPCQLELMEYWTRHFSEEEGTWATISRGTHRWTRGMNASEVGELGRELDAVRGTLVSLVVPPRAKLVRNKNMLRGELNRMPFTAGFVLRHRAVTLALKRLGEYDVVPPNGLALFAGIRDDDEEITVDFEPPRPVDCSFYLLDGRFHNLEEVTDGR